MDINLYIIDFEGKPIEDGTQVTVLITDKDSFSILSSEAGYVQFNYPYLMEGLVRVEVDVGSKFSKYGIQKFNIKYENISKGFSEFTKTLRLKFQLRATRDAVVPKQIG